MSNKTVEERWVESIILIEKVLTERVISLSSPKTLVMSSKGGDKLAQLVAGRRVNKGSEEEFKRIEEDIDLYRTMLSFGKGDEKNKNMNNRKISNKAMIITEVEKFQQELLAKYAENNQIDPSSDRKSRVMSERPQVLADESSEIKDEDDDVIFLNADGSERRSSEQPGSSANDSEELKAILAEIDKPVEDLAEENGSEESQGLENESDDALQARAKAYNEITSNYKPFDELAEAARVAAVQPTNRLNELKGLVEKLDENQKPNARIYVEKFEALGKTLQQADSKIVTQYNSALENFKGALEVKNDFSRGGQLRLVGESLKELESNIKVNEEAKSNADEASIVLDQEPVPVAVVQAGPDTKDAFRQLATRSTLIEFERIRDKANDLRQAIDTIKQDPAFKEFVEVKNAEEHARLLQALDETGVMSGAKPPEPTRTLANLDQDQVAAFKAIAKLDKLLAKVEKYKVPILNSIFKGQVREHLQAMSQGDLKVNLQKAVEKLGKNPANAEESNSTPSRKS